VKGKVFVDRQTSTVIPSVSFFTWLFCW